MGLGLLGDATVAKHCVEVKRRVLFDGVQRGSHSPFNHVHVAQGVRVDGTVGKFPLGVPCPAGRRLEEIAVKGHVLTGKGGVVGQVGKLDEFVDQICLRLLAGVGNLGIGHTVDSRRPSLNMGPFPNAALLVYLTLRMAKIERP